MKKQIESLQILRAIAFLEIFLGHCGITFFTGAFGVSIFIVLSGFCMALNYLPKADKISLSPVSNIKYALLKIKKLYGLQLVMLVAAFLLAQMPTSAEAIKRLVMDVLLVQSLSPNSADFFSYNGVAWYLSAYLFICIFSLYVIKLISKCKNKKMAAIGGILGNLYVGKYEVLLVTILSFTITAAIAMLVQYIGKTKNRKYIPNIN